MLYQSVDDKKNDTMPCAAGSACNIKGNTPGPPHFTSHRCRACNGYLHGTCGVADPFGDHEKMERVCRTCVRSRKSKGASRPAGSGTAPKRPSLKGKKGKGKARVGGKSAEVISLTSTDDANGKKGATHKARGADNRKRLNIREKAEALELLKTMKGTAVAQKFGIGESTLYKMKKGHGQIKEKAAIAKLSMKSAKGAQFAEVR